MTDFKAKMHQIRFRLGLSPRPRWGSLQRSPDPLAGFGGLLLRREKGRGGEGKGHEPPTIWRKEWGGRGEYASLALGGMDATGGEGRDGEGE